MKTIIFSLIFLCFSIYAQTDSPDFLKQKLRFSHLTVDDGLSQGFVSSITQDKNDFMWFGTADGLNRFDGYDFRVFRFNASDTTSLPDNFVTELYTDKAGRIWTGTFLGGLSCFNIETETFYRFPITGDNSNRIIGDHIFSILEDTTAKQPTFWITTNSKILNQLVLLPDSSDSNSTILPPNQRWLSNAYRVFYNSLIPEDSLKRLTSDEITNKYYGGSGPFPLALDNQNNLWVGYSNRELSRIKLISKYDVVSFPDRKTFQHINLKFKQRQDDVDDITYLYVDKNGIVWAGTNLGISQITDSSNQFINYKENTYWWNASEQSSKNAEYKNEIIVEIAEDQSGKLWISTRGGLYSFSSTNKQVTSYPNDPRDPESPLADNLASVFVDEGNVLWFGSSGYGISFVNPSREIFHHYSNPYKKNFSIYDIKESSKNHLWLQSSKRRIWYYFNREINHIDLSPFNLTNYEAKALTEDKEGNLWFISEQKLFTLERGNKNKSTLIHSFKENHEINIHISKDHSGKIWAADPNELLKIDSKTKKIKNKYSLNNLLNNEELLKCEITGIYSNKNKAWISSNTGLFEVDLITGETKLYQTNSSVNNALTTNDILTLYPDPIVPDKFIWLGTRSGGLNMLNIVTNEITYFTSRDGLPNDVIYGILSDDNNNLWMSTNYGLSCMKLQKDTLANGEITSKIVEFTNYDKTDGLQGNEFNRRSFLKTEEGELVFGGLHGFNIFKPSEVEKNKHIPQVEITGLRVNYMKIGYGTPDSILTRPISQTKSITLSYDQNTLSFQLAALDYSSVHKNQFSFLLEGYNEEWSKPQTERTITFTKLPPGSYTLHIKGSNNSGVWNDKGTKLSISITPPFWRTWWAYLIYVLLFLLSIVIVIRSERNRQKLRYNAYQKNLEAEKFKEVNRVKSDFFANISHELRTPLTLILGMIDITSREEKDKTKKEKLNIALKYSKKLLKLINELLQLSKIDAGQENFTPQTGNIVPLVKNITSLFQSLAKMKKIQLLFETDIDEIIVDFDKDKIEKIMNNLLSNALKFTPSNGNISVKLSIDVLEQNKASHLEEVKITVSDTGIGIDSEKLPFIFDRFYQAGNNGGDESNQGTGIGLALTSELVQLHKGGISVESIKEKGTTFTIRLPISTGEISITDSELVSENNDSKFDIDQIVEESQTLREEKYEVIKSKEKDVLIIDDNPDLRLYIKDSLQDDYDIMGAENGEEGLKLAEQEIPDLIITDLMMPKIDGYELTRLLRENKMTSHIPIIMLTARAAEEDKFSGLESGVDAYLTKPFSTKELQIRVRKLIELRQKLQQQTKSKVITKPAEVEVSSLDQEFLKNLHEEVEQNISNENYDVEKLASSLAVSSRQLRRKLKALTDLTPAQYIRSTKMNRAKELLEKDAGNVTEIAFQIGYSNINSFTKAFKEEFDILPSSILQKKN